MDIALATLNALLNATSAVLLLFGRRFIRRGERESHRKCMVTAFSASSLFLVSYILRMVIYGPHKIAAEGTLRTIYLSILISHMTLAASVPPLAGRTLYLALKQRFGEHRKIARVTFPIWMYVSVTGVVVYTMLYHFPGYAPPP